MAAKKAKKAKAAKKAAPAGTSPGTVTPIEWTRENAAAASTYVTLLTLDQLDVTVSFQDAETRRLDSLLYWTIGSTAASRRARARNVARALDDELLSRWAAREPDSTPIGTFTALSKFLLDGEKTLRDLATECERHYVFA